MITECLEVGWNSVLFDASQLPVAENQRQTVEVVAEARRYGAQVEGEIESITGVEDGIGSDTESARQTLEVSLEFITRDRGRRLRPGDRQRARRLPVDTDAGRPAGHRCRRGHRRSLRAARRKRADRRAVQAT